VIELALLAGLDLDPWQRLVLEVALGERADGSWSAFEVCLIVPRQNGKGAILEARELAALFLFEERLILHSAHEFKTAHEAFLRLRGLIESKPDLARKCKFRDSNEVSIETRSGSRLLFVARSRGSGRGFTGDCVILDEAYNLGAEAMGALLPTLSARPNPQIWYTSSAPMALSSQLHAVRRRGVSGNDSRLGFCEWSVDPDDDPEDEAAWSKANPALGIRIDPGFVRAEMAAMPRAEFLRERLGVPDEERGASTPLIGPETWLAVADSRSQWTGAPVGVVDVSPDGRASMVLAGMRADGLRHVELVDARAGTGWVTSRRDELTARYGVVRWLRDPSGPAVALPGEWHDIKARELTEACAGFLRDTLEGTGFRWRCAEDLEQPLDVARASVVRGERGDGSWVWSRRRSGADISPLVAVTLGWWAAPLSSDRTDPLLAVW
jgi:hypothetical protein